MKQGGYGSLSVYEDYAMNAKSKKPDQELLTDDVKLDSAQDQNNIGESDQNQEKIIELVRMVKGAKFADIHPLEVDHMISHNWLIVNED